MVYPVKSLPGISIENTELDSFGFKNDRRWMLCTPEGQSITMREFPKLTLLDVIIEHEDVVVSTGNEYVRIPLEYHKTEGLAHSSKVKLWKSKIEVVYPFKQVSEWFSDYLGTRVLFAEKVSDKKRFAGNTRNQVSFHDSDQMLFIGDKSIKYLSDKYGKEVSWQRFRPNVVLNTETPHEEDYWKDISIGSLNLSVRKKCGRCSMVNIDPIEGVSDKDILNCLSEYRRTGNKISFGVYANTSDYDGKIIRVGDEVVIN